MVQPCQVEAAIVEKADTLVQSRAEPQVGLLLGRTGIGSKNVVLLACKTPRKHGIEAFEVIRGSTGRKGNKKDTTVVGIIDSEWVAEHALQVSRMLPGGLFIVGLYMLCEENVPSQCPKQIFNALDAIKDGLGMEELPTLLLSMDSVTGKCAMKEVAMGMKGSVELRPCETKFIPNLASNFAAVQGRFSLKYEHVVSGGRALGADLVRSALMEAREKLRDSVGLVGGAVASSAGCVADTFPQASVAQPVEAQLLIPASDSNEGCGVGELQPVRGRLLLSGCLAGTALVHKRETLAAAVQLLKDDLSTSLAVREELLVEAMTEGGAGSAAAAHASRMQSACLCMPRRALVVAGDVLVCDYVAEGEGPAQVVDHVRELLGLEVTQDDVRMVEREGQVAGCVQPWHPLSRASSCVSTITQGKRVAHVVTLVTNFGILFALWVAVMWAYLGSQTSY